MFDRGGNETYSSLTNHTPLTVNGEPHPQRRCREVMTKEASGTLRPCGEGELPFKNMLAAAVFLFTDVSISALVHRVGYAVLITFFEYFMRVTCKELAGNKKQFLHRDPVSAPL